MSNLFKKVFGGGSKPRAAFQGSEQYIGISTSQGGSAPVTRARGRGPGRSPGKARSGPIKTPLGVTGV